MNNNLSVNLLPQIKELSKRDFNNLAIEGTCADLVIVYDHNDRRLDCCFDTIVRNLFVGSDVCCICKMDEGSLNDTIESVFNSRTHNLGVLAQNRQCKVLFLLTAFDSSSNNIAPDVARLISLAQEKGTEVEICFLVKKTNTKALAVSDPVIQSNTSRCYFTYADSAHISLLLFLILYGKCNLSEKLVIIDYGTVCNATEYRMAHHAKSFLSSMFITENTTFDPKLYWDETIKGFIKSFLDVYPVHLDYLPHYGLGYRARSSSLLIKEYYGVTENGKLVSEILFETLLSEFVKYSELKFEDASVAGIIPVSFFIDDTKYDMLSSTLANLKAKSKQSVNRLAFHNEKAKKTKLSEYSSAWSSDFRNNCYQRLCDILIQKLPSVRQRAREANVSAQDSLLVLDANYKTAPDASFIIPDGKNWLNYSLDDLIGSYSNDTFSPSEYLSISSFIGGIAMDGDSNCMNILFANYESSESLTGFTLVSIASLPEGLMIGGRVRGLAR